MKPYRYLSILFLLILTACGAVIRLDGLSVELPQHATNSPATATIAPSPTLRPTIAATASPSPTLASIPTVTTLVNLNLRSAATINSSILTVIPANTTLQLFGRSADSAWLSVRYGSFTGWVSSADNLVRINGASLGSLPIVTSIPPSPTIEPSPTQERPKQRMSYNVNGESIPDRNALTNHLLRLCPTTVLIMNNLAYAVELQQALRSCGTLVVHRTYSYYEGDEWVIRSPQQIVNAWIAEGYPQIIRYSVNEASFGGTHTIQAFISSQVEVMRLAREAGYTVVCCNFSVARETMEEMRGGFYDPLIRAVVQYGDYIGAHEYTQPVLAFGVSQWPLSYLLDRTKVQPANWPTMAQLPTAMQFDTTIHAMNYPRYYHLRRADWFLLRADEIGVARPRIWLTEFGFDAMNDVKPTLEPFRGIYCVRNGKYFCDFRGVNTYELLWHFYFPQWNFPQAICQQLIWANSVYPAEYIGIDVFTWSSNPMWLHSDYSGKENGGMYELQACLESA